MNDLNLYLPLDFHSNESCYRRGLFVEVARCFLETNSKQAFKDSLFEQVCYEIIYFKFSFVLVLVLSVEQCVHFLMA